MKELTDILEKHWKRQSVKYNRTGNALKWMKTLRGVRCIMCRKSLHEKKIDEAFPGWGVILSHFSIEGKMAEVCPKCMRKISHRQIPVPRIAVCVDCGIAQREKIFGLGFSGWQTIRFPAQGIKPAVIRITDLWCPDCSIKLARKLGPEFVRGSWTDQSALFTANSLLTSTQMQNLYLNVTEAAYPHNNLIRNSSFESWTPGIAVRPDEWTIGAGAMDREAGTVRIGTYSCNINTGVANALIYQDFSGFAFLNYGAKDFTFGCWVYSNSVQALIRITTANHGGGTTVTTAHSGALGWEWLEATLTLDANATGIRVECENDNSGTDQYFDGAILTESEHVEAWCRKKDETIWLTTPLTDTDWDGEDYSTSEADIDLSAFGNGCPPRIKAVLVTAMARDSGSAAEASCYFSLGPGGIAMAAASDANLIIRLEGSTDQKYRAASSWVSCDANGDIRYKIEASGDNTLDVWIKIWGYVLGE